MENKKILYLTQAALIAAIYVVLVFIFKPISFSFLQVRIAEALTILPYFVPSAIPGITIGCLLANITGEAGILDIIFGTLATFIGALGSYGLRRYKFLVPLPPVLSNAIIIPWVLRLAFGEATPILIMTLTIGAGQVISCYVLGLLLLFGLEKYKHIIFKNN